MLVYTRVWIIEISAVKPGIQGQIEIQGPGYEIQGPGFECIWTPANLGI